MDLKQLVQNSLEKMEAEGKITEMVESRVHETVQKVVDDVLDPWSTFGKELKSHIKANLNINLDDLKMEEYQQNLLNIVRSKITMVMSEDAVSKINKELDKLLFIDFKEYKLSELVEQVKNTARDIVTGEFEDGYEGTDMSLHVEDGSSLVWIYLDKEENKEKYDCEYRLTFCKRENTITQVQLGEKDLSKVLQLGGFYGIDKLLYQLYAGDVKFILDEGDCDTYYEYRD